MQNTATNGQSRPFRILGIPGSLRRTSYNRGLLRAAREDAPDGVDIGEFDLSTIPLFNEDVEARGDPPPVRELKEHIRRFVTSRSP